MYRTVVNSITGERTDVPLTPAELDAYNAALVNELPDAKNSAKDAIGVSLVNRINQGVLWQWNGGTTQYAIPLYAENREFLTALKMDLLLGQTDPHNGYLQFNGEKLLALGGGPLPREAAEEICLFCSLWGQKISRIALAEKDSIDGMDLATVQAYDASAIDWSVIWVGHSDWTDDLVLYIPNV